MEQMSRNVHLAQPILCLLGCKKAFDLKVYWKNFVICSNLSSFSSLCPLNVFVLIITLEKLETVRAVIRDGIVLIVTSSSFDPWQIISESSQSQKLWLQMSDKTLDTWSVTRTHLKHQWRFYILITLSPRKLTPGWSLPADSSSRGPVKGRLWTTLGHFPPTDNTGPGLSLLWPGHMSVPGLCAPHCPHSPPPPAQRCPAGR